MRKSKLFLLGSTTWFVILCMETNNKENDNITIMDNIEPGLRSVNFIKGIIRKDTPGK